MKIKGFDKELKCRGFQFEIGKEYKIDSQELRLCSDTVFHYCNSMLDVHKYYSSDSDNRYCEIEVMDEEVTDGNTYGSNHIRIVREIVGEELNTLLGKINGNIGIFNSGNMNSGYRNSGDMNSGDWNSGNSNFGNSNSGDRNSGNMNSGYRNSGNMNSGYRNSGDMNSGDWNSGNMNSGNSNSGNRNSGYKNSGNMNSGNMNSGNMNSGNSNSGDMNSGHWNSCNYSNGVFNSVEDDNIRIFNRPSGMSHIEFLRSKYYQALSSEPLILTEWVEHSDKDHSANCYLKTYTYKEACANWWARLTEGNKKIIMSIPNFDKGVFEEITGIRIS